MANGPYIYDPYGNCTVSGGGACSTSNLPAFTGQILDAETGLYYYRARYYSPVIGRFLQTDPVGYSADLNLYTYAGNDPTDKTDPTGNCTINNRCDAEYGDIEGVNETFSDQPVLSLHRDIGSLANPNRTTAPLPNAAATNSGATRRQGTSSDAKGADQPTNGTRLAQEIIGPLLEMGARPPIVPPEAAEQLKVPVEGLSGKEGATNVPSWARGLVPRVGEAGKDAAKRAMDKQYPDQNWRIMPRRMGEFRKIQKYFDRHFKDPDPALPTPDL